jgi:hypothetical protein
LDGLLELLCPFGKEALLGVEAKKCWAVRRLFV